MAMDELFPQQVEKGPRVHENAMLGSESGKSTSQQVQGAARTNPEEVRLGESESDVTRGNQSARVR